VNQDGNFAVGLRPPHRSYSDRAGRFVQGHGRGRKRRRDRGVPCRGGPRRVAVLLQPRHPPDGAAPRGDRPRHRRRLPPVRVRIDTGSLAILLPPGEKALWNPGRGSGEDRVGTGPVPRLSLSCVQRGYCQSAGGYRGHRGCVPGAGDLPAEEGPAAIRAPSGRRRSPRRPADSRPVADATRRFARGWTRSLWIAGDLVVSYEGLFELAAYEPGQSGPFPR